MVEGGSWCEQRDRTHPKGKLAATEFKQEGVSGQICEQRVGAGDTEAGTSSQGRLPGPRRGSWGGQIHGNLETGHVKGMGEEGLRGGPESYRSKCVHSGGGGGGRGESSGGGQMWGHGYKRGHRAGLPGSCWGAAIELAGIRFSCGRRLTGSHWECPSFLSREAVLGGAQAPRTTAEPSWWLPPSQLSQGWDNVVWRAPPPVSPVPELPGTPLLTFCPQNIVTCWLPAAKTAGTPRMDSGRCLPSSESGRRWMMWATGGLRQRCLPIACCLGRPPGLSRHLPEMWDRRTCLRHSG